MSYSPYQETQEEKGNYAPLSFGGTSSDISLVTQTSPLNVFERIEHRLKGEKYNETKDTWEEVQGLRQMNDKGINSIMTDVEAGVNFIWSNLRNDEEVMRIVNRLGKTITRKLAANWKDWDVDKSNMTSIIIFVCHQALASTRRGYQSGEREFLKKNVIEHHQTTQQVGGNVPQSSSDKKHFWEVWKK